MTRVLITGGAGFIGSHVARRCIARGDEVHITARPGTSLERLRGVESKLRLHRVDLRDRERMRECFVEVKPQRVFHLAANTRSTPEPDLGDALATVFSDLVTLITLLALAEEMRPAVEVLVRAGSLAEYGHGSVPYVESQREAPLDARSSALVAGAHYSRMLQPRLPFPVITARLALIYGPRQSEDFLVPMMIRRCLIAQPMTLHRPGDRRDWMYVDDAVDALMCLADVPPPGGTIINIATGIAPTVQEIAGLILGATGADPTLIEPGNGPTPEGIAHQQGSPTLMRELTGWQASTPLAEGITRTVAWYRERLASPEGVKR
jgi:nucleoside-diphosphate-sugar epimerase